MKTSHLLPLTLVLLLAAGTASATLPVPSDAAKANTLDNARQMAEAAAKAAHACKVANFQLCKVQDKVAADYMARSKKAGTAVKPAVATPACADPGPFVAAAPAK